MKFKSRLTKWMFIILAILLGLTAVSVVLSFIILEKKHKEEITRVITNNGGIVIKIKRVEREDSPFHDDSNKSNVIYKITYTKTESELIAWYRGVNVVNNIHAENPTALQGGFGEKWIF